MTRPIKLGRGWRGLLTIAFAFAAVNARSDVSDKLTYHNDAQRSGWNRQEKWLTPARVASGYFGLLWQTPMLDAVNGVPPRLFATPLYLHDVRISSGPHQGSNQRAVFAISSTGFAYAIAAFGGSGASPGDVLWRRQLSEAPCEEATMGNLSTPVIDSIRRSLYITACTGSGLWALHALDVTDGTERPGWPVALDSAAINQAGINRNGATRFQDEDRHIQRGALNLSADNRHVYIPFGFDTSSGWLVVVDTRLHKVVTAFSTTAATEQIQGGMWASGGPSIDPQGRIYVSTGASSTQMFKHAGIPGVFPESEHSWGQSILQFIDRPQTGLELLGTYTPFNYCLAAANDIDLGSSGTLVIDDAGGETTARHFVALVGGKQGNAYLLDRERMPGGVLRRHACNENAWADQSLLAPETQPQFQTRGPLNIFGPYSDTSGSFDQGKSRSTAAFFQPSKAQTYLYASGSSKRSEKSSESVPPGLIKLQLIKGVEGQYLRVNRRELTQIFQNPGSPVVSSHGPNGAIVWVLDANAPRTATLYGTHALHPVLYAFDAQDLHLLWRSDPSAFPTGGKYNEPTVADGVVFVGTDRLQAFGIRSSREINDQSRDTIAPSVEWHRDRDARPMNSTQFAMRSTQTASPVRMESRGEYGNFELHLRYRADSPSGCVTLGFRRDSQNGYATLIGTGDTPDVFSIGREGRVPVVLAHLSENAESSLKNGAPTRTISSLVNSPERIKSALKPYPAWNEYVLSVSGNQMSQAINGVLVNQAADDDFDYRSMRGTLSLTIAAEAAGHIELSVVRMSPVSWPYLWATRYSSKPQSALATLPIEQRRLIEAGHAIFQDRCRICHANPESGAPALTTLAQYPPALITDALLNGRMRSMGAGLDEDARNAVAAFLTNGWVETQDAAAP